jgi:oligoribonuclease NrnB/cAMP/cGMP phosphodiesterase (DHH superfamily)
MRYPQAKIFFTSYGKENFHRISELIYGEVIKNPGRGLLIFCDLGLNEEIIPLVSELFEFLHSNSWSIVWIDHHPWTNEALSLFGNIRQEQRKLVLDSSGKKCASELAYEFLLKDNMKAQNLALMAHTSDFLLKDQFLPPLPELIIYYKTLPNFYNKLTCLCRKICKGILWDTEMQEEYIIFSKLRDESKVESWEKLQEVQLSGGIKMGIVPTGPYIQSSLFSEEIFEKTTVDVIFFLTRDGKVSIRRRNPILNCNDIASGLLEGGGHKYAAGGKIRSDTQDINLVISELKNAVENSLNIKND